MPDPMAQEDQSLGSPEISKRAVKVQLESFGDKVQKLVDEVLPPILQAVYRKGQTLDFKALNHIGTKLQVALAELVPELTDLRSMTSAVDGYSLNPMDNPKALMMQRELLLLQNYTAIAAPVVMHQMSAAFTSSNDTIVSGIADGIHGSLKYLEPTLRAAWKAMDYQVPLVKALLQANSSDDPHLFVTAGCAADYSTALGDLTQVLVELTNARVDCLSTTAKMPKPCAKDSTMALWKVFSAVAQASDVMWQCFGLFWGCTQLLNSALSDMLEALTDSMVMSTDCESTTVDVCKPKTFLTVSKLVEASGRIYAAADTCHEEGSQWTPPSPDQSADGVTHTDTLPQQHTDA
eukprot:gb/GFBE01058940.1/.p1 GENE.gb/GFBE01058940.1/~~gb/GFBE01058940.1/.p1  ORF type:complete len:349 (+),score=81.83 gb/GFBE01058940.1/:1-1047(+)